MLVYIPRRVNKRRVQQRRYDEDNITRNNERPYRLEIVHAVESEESKENIVDELAYQSRKIVPKPEESVPVPAELSRKIPPGMVKPDISELTDSVDQ